MAGIEIDDELRVEMFARLDAQVTDDGRKLVGHTGKGKRSKRVRGLKHVALTGNQSAAKIGIEEIFLGQLPAEEFLRAAVFLAPVEALGDTVFEFVGVRESFIFIKAHEAAEIQDSVHIAVNDFRLDDVFPFGAGI